MTLTRRSRKYTHASDRTCAREPSGRLQLCFAGLWLADLRSGNHIKFRRQRAVVVGAVRRDGFQSQVIAFLRKVVVALCLKAPFRVEPVVEVSSSFPIFPANGLQVVKRVPYAQHARTLPDLIGIPLPVQILVIVEGDHRGQAVSYTHLT